ncbi:MAG: hypothetical protein LAT55_00240 [Opitutales bacterium]|nr:hypothetical protein [Opitutales bacterium]
MPWQQQFQTEHSNSQVLGYLDASREAFRRYFREAGADEDKDSPPQRRGDRKDLL